MEESGDEEDLLAQMEQADEDAKGNITRENSRPHTSTFL